MGDFDGSANVGDSLALGDQLLSGFELADDLLSCVADLCHGEDPSPVWPDEDSHSPWSDFQGPCQRYGKAEIGRVADYGTELQAAPRQQALAAGALRDQQATSCEH